MKELMYAWLIIALMFVLFEIAHPGLFLFLSFAIGACSAAVASWYEYSFIVQCAVALGGSLFGFFCLYRWLRLKGYTGPQQGTRASNIDALVGKHGMVIKEIDSNGFGRVKINGEIWSARSVHNAQIGKGKYVQIIQVRGAHVVVKEIISK